MTVPCRVDGRTTRQTTGPLESGKTECWLLYDGDCGFCRGWCDWARARGADRTVRFQPCDAASDLREQAGLSDADCQESAHLLLVREGSVIEASRAAAAINGVLARLPGKRNAFFRIFAALYRIPGLRQLEELGYRIIARNRHRLGATSCAPDSRDQR